MKSYQTLFVCAAWAAGAILSVASVASAEGDGVVSPSIEYSAPGWSILYSLVALAGLLYVGFKPSGRTHLD